MFSSLKLNSLKCQSNSSGDKKKDKYDGDGDDDVSEHMYEKLPNYDSENYRYHPNYVSKSPKYMKTSFSKRISKWKMECPGIASLKISSPNLECENNYSSERNSFNSGTPYNIRKKITTINVGREDGNLGITLRGGLQTNADLSKPITITYVRPDGPVAGEGTIKCGDRLLAVDGISLNGKSLSDAQTLLRRSTPSTLLTVEYDVNVLDTVEHAQGPLLVEMELNSFQDLGVRLGQSEDGIVIESVKPGSMADRCGAFHAGDAILAVNSTRMDCTALAIEDVIKFIECNCPVLRLEILPLYAVLNYSDVRSWKSKDLFFSHGSLFSGINSINTLKSHAGRRHQDCKSTDLSQVTEKMLEFKPCLTNLSGFHGNNMVLTHSETIHTTLNRDNGIFGLECVDSPDGWVVIKSVADGSPAEKSQCLYPGDRILTVNNRNIALDNLCAKDVNELLEGTTENSLCVKVSLHTEFDVLDSVIPATGIFTVKLAKRGSSGLGITITASKSSGFRVYEMKKGSIAYRAGSLIAGDKILAINNIPLNKCSVEYAANILNQSSKIVTLRVQRKGNGSESVNIRTVTYTVELQRYGGPLGITIAGSEEPFHPITISGLSSGGLGEQTGVLHVGDEILAINDHNLYGEPLSKAHHLLQNSPDFVTLKISRPITPYCRFSSSRSPSVSPSIDNANEPWDNSRSDLTSSAEHEDSRTKQNYSIVSDNDANETKRKSTKTLVEADIPDLSVLDEISSENLKIKKELDLLSLKLDAETITKSSEVKVNNERSGIVNEDAESDVFDVDGKISNSSGDEGGTTDFGNSGSAQIQFDLNPKYIHSHKIEAGEQNELNSEYKQDNNEPFTTNDLDNLEITFMSDPKSWFKSNLGNLGNEYGPESIRSDLNTSQLYKVTLYKDPIYEDFGFSVSDGLYERGVFINRIRRGGPADLNNVLQPYDRILQVNGTLTQDFDCCLTVPLIASAGDSITLLVARGSTEHLAGKQVPENEKLVLQESHSSPNLAFADIDTEKSQKILL